MVLTRLAMVTFSCGVILLVATSLSPSFTLSMAAYKTHRTQETINIWVPQIIYINIFLYLFAKDIFTVYLLAFGIFWSNVNYIAQYFYHHGFKGPPSPIPKKNVNCVEDTFSSLLCSCNKQLCDVMNAGLDRGCNFSLKYLVDSNGVWKAAKKTFILVVSLHQAVKILLWL